MAIDDIDDPQYRHCFELTDTNGDGTVFQITTHGQLTTLYSFTGGNDGSFLFAALIQASEPTAALWHNGVWWHLWRRHRIPNHHQWHADDPGLV